jgi:predicted transcriptional regulator
MEKEKKLKDFQMNRENPFAKQVLVKMGKFLSNRQITGKNGDERSVLKAVDENTGEILGQTVFMRTKMVDTETFAKVYQLGFQAFADLKPSVMKVFQFIVKQLTPNKDNFNLYIEDLIEETELHKATIYRALGTLCERQIIARGRTEYEYYINPMYVFNGNRVTFITNWINTNVPEYKTSEKQLKSTIQIMSSQGFLPKQASLPFEFDDDDTIFPNIEKQEI